MRNIAMPDGAAETPTIADRRPFVVRALDSNPLPSSATIAVQIVQVQEAQGLNRHRAGRMQQQMDHQKKPSTVAIHAWMGSRRKYPTRYVSDAPRQLLADSLM